MPGATREIIDKAGGVILTPPQSFVYANGYLIATVGTKIQSHGESPHKNARMVTGSSTVFIKNQPVCRAGDSASCGHVSTGSRNVFVG